MSEDVHFLVGKTPEGQTILRVGDSIATTLTIDQQSTVDLIRLLASTLDDDQSKFSITIEPKDQQWHRANKL
jgi:hypothetical protein